MAVGAGGLPDFKVVKGFELGIASAGIKSPGRKDLVIMKYPEASTVAGVFTTNAFCAAPVHIAKKHLTNGKSQYLLTNTGNANAGTGENGFAHASACCEAIAQHTDVGAEAVLPFSTGVIGEVLPVDKIIAAIPAALENLAEDNWSDAAEGILTTDTRPKGASRQFEYEGELVTITGISKGAGMIKPNMATMLAYVATDLSVEQSLLQQLISTVANKSFNRISIDGDTSTNDSFILVATGQTKLSLNNGSGELFNKFSSVLNELCAELAQAIVRDGEGATKFVTVNVEKALSQQEALDVAYTIAHSPLVKTALFASDPNWGRILAAVGRAGVENLVLDELEIYLNDVCIVENGGRASSYTETAGQAVMDQAEITITVNLQRGNCNEVIWTTDLSHEYVRVNAEYRT